MAARAPKNSGEASDEMETVKCPGALVMSAYCTCPDVSLTVTPDLKLPDFDGESKSPNKINGGMDSSKQ